MKSILFVVTAFLCAQAVHADVIPGWERPVAKAELKLSQALGVYSHVQEAYLVMTKQDGAEDPTGFTLFIDNQMTAFYVKGKSVDRCGNTFYDLKLIRTSLSIESKALSGTLRDSGDSICSGTASPTTWEIRLQSEDVLHGRDLGSLAGDGNPVPLRSIQ